MMPESVNYDTQFLANSISRLNQIVERINKIMYDTDLVKPISIVECRFDKTGLLVAGKTIVDYCSGDNDDDEDDN